MAATAVLRSHDVLQNSCRFHETRTLTPPPSSSRPRRTSNANVQISSNTNGAVKSGRRKRSPVKSPPPKKNNERSRDRALVVKSPSSAAAAAGKGLVMGHVKILKRGEPLDLAPAKNEGDGDGRSGSVTDSGSGSEMVKNEVRVDVKSDLELTDRLGPNPENMGNEIRVGGVYAGSGMYISPHPSSLPLPGFLGLGDAATSDLRRLLRLI